jgi:hypothetical protein
LIPVEIHWSPGNTFAPRSFAASGSRRLSRLTAFKAHRLMRFAAEDIDQEGGDHRPNFAVG